MIMKYLILVLQILFSVSSSIFYIIWFQGISESWSLSLSYSILKLCSAEADAILCKNKFLFCQVFGTLTKSDWYLMQREKYRLIIAIQCVRVMEKTA